MRQSLPAGGLRRLPSDFVMPEVPVALEWRTSEERREEEQIEFSWAGETARHVGTMMRRWLQRMAKDELRGWTKKRIEGLRSRFADELQRRGVQPLDIAHGALLSSAQWMERVANCRTETSTKRMTHSEHFSSSKGSK